MKWEVWFVPELPISAGPWKLCGLPGLILYDEDKDKEFIFEATGIETDTDEITPVYVPKCMKRRNVKNYCVPNANTPITLWPPIRQLWAIEK
ncbi:MAG: GLPGLI family protein [Muribaculaceae bacterium]|nr:GLPGLI family protein [Bacteroides sp.]MDE6681217.1 GLPGLI family protein [Muribaculaceae bacterium]MDE6803306.1 GLPGLI family protein [Muribaculaceae bacterium]MDE6843124.1 GLPGLI family protein [Muribaculaceae bacterium]MDE7189654.1 GLPGLI family protein [Muribaculaceae bacterium]